MVFKRIDLGYPVTRIHCHSMNAFFLANYLVYYMFFVDMKIEVFPNNDKGKLKGYLIFYCFQEKAHVFDILIQVKSPITSPSSLCNSPSVSNQADCFP